MPCGKQSDIDMAYLPVRHLGIRYYEINIQKTVDAAIESIEDIGDISRQTRLNLPARIRMATLYAVSQSMNGRVANTCNLSEDYEGYVTRYGDGAGDFSPLSRLMICPYFDKTIRTIIQAKAERRHIYGKNNHPKLWDSNQKRNPILPYSNYRCGWKESRLVCSDL